MSSGGVDGDGGVGADVDAAAQRFNSPSSSSSTTTSRTSSHHHHHYHPSAPGVFQHPLPHHHGRPAEPADSWRPGAAAAAHEAAATTLPPPPPPPPAVAAALAPLLRELAALREEVARLQSHTQQQSPQQQQQQQPGEPRQEPAAFAAAESSADTSGNRLTHVDATGRAAMVDVAGKAPTLREARASCRVLLGREAFALVAANALKKGDVLATAQLAGVMGAKATSQLIPLCHPLLLTKVMRNDGAGLALSPWPWFPGIANATKRP